MGAHDNKSKRKLEKSEQKSISVQKMGSNPSYPLIPPRKLTTAKPTAKEEILIHEKRRIKRCMRVFQIALLFYYRMLCISKRIKLLGKSNISINPCFRKSSQIKAVYEENDKCARMLTTGTYKPKKPANNNFLFYSDQMGIIIWNLISIPLLLYIVIFIPYFLVFNISIFVFNTFEKMIDVYFIFDILVNFNTAYLANEYRYETRRTKIAKKYLKTYFIIDLLTSIPISWIMEGTGRNVSFNKLLRIAKLPKLMQTSKASKFLKLSYILKALKLGDFWRYKIKAKESFFKALMLGITTYLVLHISGCLFIYLGFMESQIPNTWIYHANLENASTGEIYLSSIYFCFVVLTTVGYGDIVGVNQYEHIFSIIWMMIGIAFYSFTISYVTFFFTSKDNRKSLCDKQIKTVRHFAKEKNLTKAMTEAIIENLELASYKISYRWLEGDFSLFKDMPLELKHDLLKEMHKELMDCPFFASKDQSFVIRIIDLLRPINLNKNEFMWKKDDKANYICFLTKGEVFLMDNNVFYDKYNEIEKIKKLKLFEDGTGVSALKIIKNTKSALRRVSENLNIFKPLESNFYETPTNVDSLEKLLDCKLFAFKLFGAGAYIGDEEIFFQTNRRFYLKAATDCELMVLSKIDFENIVKSEFPHIYKKLFNMAEKKLKNNLKEKNKLIETIGKLSKKENVDIKTDRFDLNTSYNSNKLLFNEPEKKIETLLDIFKQTDEKHHIDQLFKDIEIVEYSQNQDMATSEEQFAEINTPGLQKIYNEWKCDIISNEN